MKKILCILFSLMIIVSTTLHTDAYPLKDKGKHEVDISQARQFLIDHNASHSLLESLDYVYEYSEEVGIDPSIIVAMTTIETGYGKSSLFKNNNNPGGIKSLKGWAHYENKQQGFRAMINLLATYAGIKNPNSWLHGYSNTTEGLAGMYWTNKEDAGYHILLTKIINNMKRYEKKSTVNKEPETENENDTDEVIDKILKNKRTSTSNILYDILNSNKGNNSGYDYIMKFAK